ncbi:MAG: hypothetical protein KGY38_07535, partial [Desulfobacterales bacterium]|nr:hypothetical protein [Desulfobacterales bacterium]
GEEKIKDGVLHPGAKGAGGLSWRFAPMHFLIRDRWSDTLRYGARMFFRPTVREWIKYPLPRRWLFLYYLLRPWRIVYGWVLDKLSGNNVFRATILRYRLFRKKQEAAGNGFFSVIWKHLPLRIMEKSKTAICEFINIRIFNRFVNQQRFARFQQHHRHLNGGHYYIIAMPECLDILAPCLDLLPDDVSFFLISNGLSQKEREAVKGRFARFPMFELKLLPGTSLSHGRVINLLLENNNENFGIMDYDLYVYNKDLFKNIRVAKQDFAAGIFRLANRKADLVFPTTHLMFFNTPVIRQIMKDYGIGAQEYKRIPMRLKKKLLSINLGYHNFLKDYLYYFDTLNLIMAMAFYKKYKARIIPVSGDDCRHLGGGN